MEEHLTLKASLDDKVRSHLKLRRRRGSSSKHRELCGKVRKASENHRQCEDYGHREGSGHSEQSKAI